MKKIWNWLKNDFRKVSEGVRELTSDKVPMGLIVIWYLLVLPLGLLFWGILIALTSYRYHRLMRYLKKVRIVEES